MTQTANPVDPANPAPSTQARPQAQAAGRGGVAVLGAKVFFIFSGLVQQTLLPKAIGTAEFGVLARVLAVASVVNNVMVASSVQGVSRAVAGAGEAEDPHVFRRALRLHLPIALALAALFWLAAPFVADFEEAPYIVTPLRVLSLVVLFYGSYAPLVGALNGRGKFTRQAALDTIFAVLRTGALVGVGWFFFKRAGTGALGAAIGFALAAACIIPIALRWSGTGKEGGGGTFDWKAYLAGLAPLALTQLLTNALMQVDIVLLGRFLSQAAHTVKIAGASSSNAADEWVGIYRYCQYFAFLPYQLVMSVTQVLFPLVARAHAEKDRASVRLYVERGARIALLASGALVAVVAALPGSVLYFVYGADAAARGADTLRTLALGQGAFTMFGIAMTVLASLGRERVAAALSFVTLVVVGIACWGLAAHAPFGHEQLRGNAVAVAGALAIGLVFAAVTVSRVAGGFVPVLSIVRVCAVVGAIVFAGTYVGTLGRVLAIVASGGVVVVYLVALVILRELGGDDLGALRAIVGRRRA
ncbi:MAG TPA: oligosaccharide flippase family protein [Polyangiaceae bacterium]